MRCIAPARRIGDEPFLLMLGDHIYRSDGERSCARQLMDAYQMHGKSIVGLQPHPRGRRSPTLARRRGYGWRMSCCST